MNEPIAPQVMAGWIGALTQGGVLLAQGETGLPLAAYFIGEAAVTRLRAHFAEASPETVRRERKAAIEACIWMACADRKVTDEERNLVLEVVRSSGLGPDDQADLIGGLDDPPSLVDIEERLACPELRELLLGLAWEMALADGQLHRQEQALLDGLVKRFGVRPDRAAEIVTAVQAQAVSIVS